jgi:hypothetical protein
MGRSQGRHRVVYGPNASIVVVQSVVKSFDQEDASST